MSRIISPLSLLVVAVLLGTGCSTDSPTEPSNENNDNTGTSPNKIEFTIDGTSYSVDALQGAISVSATGLTSLTGSTAPGTEPGAFIGLSFKLARQGSVRLSNTGDDATDDEFALVLGGKTYRTTYYECVGDRSVLRYADLGTVIVERADAQEHRISGTFSGTLALETTRKVQCGSFEESEFRIFPISGRFDCTWAHY